MTNCDKRILALRKPIWGVGEVRCYRQCSESKAYREISVCREMFDGAIGGLKQAKRDAFLKMIGTDFETEMRNAYCEKEAEQNAKAKREKEIFPPRLQVEG